MIMENQFSPWEPLSEFRLAQLLEISRTPVREAITQLEQEGMLKVVPGKGAFVIELTKEDFQEINNLRIVLEPLAAETSACVIPEKFIAEQKAVWSGVLESLKTGLEMLPSELTECDNRLHWLFIDYCGNSRLRSFLGVLRCQTMRYIYATWETRALMEDTVRQHLEIISALEQKDVPNLCRLLKNHIDFNTTVYDYRER